MTTPPRDHLPAAVQAALGAATADGPGGRPEHGALGETLKHLQVDVLPLDDLALGAAATDGTRLFLDAAALQRPPEALAAILLSAAAVLVGHRIGVSFGASWASVLSEDACETLARRHPDLAPAPVLDAVDLLAPVYGTGEDLMLQITRGHRRAAEALEADAPVAAPRFTP